MGLKIDFKFVILDLKKWEIFLQNEINRKFFYNSSRLKKWEIFLQKKKIGNFEISKMCCTSIRY